MRLPLWVGCVWVGSTKLAGFIYNPAHDSIAAVAKVMKEEEDLSEGENMEDSTLINE